MSRVLLFVQNDWNGRPPRCIKQFGGDSARALVYVSKARTWNHAADRWWLVECENAQAGRVIIEHAGKPVLPHPLAGRILASGGKEPSDA